MALKKSGRRPFSWGVRSVNAVEASWFGDDLLEIEGRAAQSVAAAAAQAVGLKVFPAVAQHVMRLLEDPNITIGDLRGPIEQDASLASRLLRVANSVAYSRGRPVNSIDEAVLRLGFDQVRAIVAGISAFGMFPADGDVAHQLRAHGAGVAAVIGVLGRTWRGGHVGDLFLSGLLHDLGKLAALQVGEVAYADLPAKVLSSPDCVHRIERMRTGYDHAALGATVLAGWRFDRDVVKTIAWHHRPGRAYAEGGDIAVAVALLRLADQIDYRLRADPELDEAFLAELAQRGETSYADISRDVLEALWPKLREAHAEMQAALIG
ncbi:MAG: HDOD domain-containing protein [Sandaracinaceae bacterium]|nr:MAG: HDOD domain-containing protein [Sandaracinaceae bacterium]